MYETMPRGELEEQLGESAQAGLTEQEAAARLERYGRNVPEQSKRRSVLMHVLCSFKDVTILILLVAMALSLYIALTTHPDNLTEPIVIAFIIVLNIALSVREQVKAEKAVESLKQYQIRTCTVLRGGAVRSMDAELLVPGDVVLLSAGDSIPADARILDETGFAADESLLTGESEPSFKDAAFLPDGEAGAADCRHMVFSGTLAVAGKCRAVVCRTGKETEIGRIAGLLAKEKPKPSPLQARMQKLGKVLSVVAFAGALLALLIGWLEGVALPEMFMVAVSVAVAAIPEVMPVVVTIALSYGVASMAKRNTIVRTPAAVETIGNVSVICSDKTGTLTQNQMRVEKIWAAGRAPLCASDAFGREEEELLKLFRLASGGQAETANSTEAAIMRLARERCGDARGGFEKVFEIPFDSARKLMTVVYRTPDGWLSVTKGAIDRLRLVPDDALQGEILSVHSAFAADALRVLGVAYRKFDDQPALTPDVLESGLSFGGLVGIIDPPREESAQAVRVAREAGIKTVMITGDHIATAKAIAERIGILDGRTKIMNGTELRSLSDDELASVIGEYRVFARTSPEDKIRIVKAFQRAGEVVAMTGDGVNDAPALKAADVGIAMGAGTDVAKEAADMILLDNNFSTIVAAVEEGRRVYSNIRKSLYSMLGCNFSALTIVLFALLFGWGSPVTALQILIIKVAADGIPGFALCIEKADPDLMKQPPVRRGESIFAGGLVSKIVQITAVFTAATLAPLLIGMYCTMGGIAPSFAVAQTMTFVVMGLTTIVHVYNCRSHFSAFSRKMGHNRLGYGTTAFGACVMVLIAAVPPVAQIFGLVPLSIWHWLVIFALSVTPLLYVEFVKAIGKFGRM